MTFHSSPSAFSVGGVIVGEDFILIQTGSSNGRGPRCANWMQDYILDITKFGRRTALKVFVLKGGIKGWVRDFEGSMVEGFVEEYWEQFK